MPSQILTIADAVVTHLNTLKTGGAFVTDQFTVVRRLRPRFDIDGGFRIGVQVVPRNRQRQPLTKGREARYTIIDVGIFATGTVANDEMAAADTAIHLAEQVYDAIGFEEKDQEPIPGFPLHDRAYGEDEQSPIYAESLLQDRLTFLGIVKFTFRSTGPIQAATVIP